MPYSSTGRMAFSPDFVDSRSSCCAMGSCLRVFFFCCMALPMGENKPTSNTITSVKGTIHEEYFILRFIVSFLLILSSYVSPADDSRVRHRWLAESPMSASIISHLPP